MPAAVVGLILLIVATVIGVAVVGYVVEKDLKDTVFNPGVVVAIFVILALWLAPRALKRGG